MQRFVDASAIGWYHYLYGDSAKANALIKSDNPDITDAQIAFSIAKLKEEGIVDSGDTLTLGIGAMTDARWKDFFDKMVEIGLVDPRTDYKKAYSLQIRQQRRRARSEAQVTRRRSISGRTAGDALAGRCEIERSLPGRASARTRQAVRIASIRCK